jgi:hypothetical protein
MEGPISEIAGAAAALRSLQQSLNAAAAPDACRETANAYDALLAATAAGLEEKARYMRQRQSNPSSIGASDGAMARIQVEVAWQEEVKRRQAEAGAALERLRQSSPGLPPEATGFGIAPTLWGPQ